jgi:hypothetical protein
MFLSLTVPVSSSSSKQPEEQTRQLVNAPKPLNKQKEASRPKLISDGGSSDGSSSDGSSSDGPCQCIWLAEVGPRAG